MIQMYLHENSSYWKLLDDLKFLELWNAIETTVREYIALERGVKKSRESTSLQMEGKLFECRALGKEGGGPVQLLRTIR